MRCNFSEEQWREIYAVRKRLEAYRDKIQPYPSEPDQFSETPQPEIKLVFHPRAVDNEIDRLKGQFLFLQKKVNELQSKKKRISKYT